MHAAFHVKEKSLHDACCSCGGDSTHGVMVLWGTGHEPALRPDWQRFTFA